MLELSQINDSFAKARGSYQKVRKELAPLKDSLETIQESQEDSIFAEEDLHISYENELALLTDFLKLSSAINNCASSLLCYVEKVINKAKQDSLPEEEFSKLAESLFTRAFDISNKFFHLSKGFYYESCAGITELARSLGAKLTGQMANGCIGNKTENPDFDYQEREVASFGKYKFFTESYDIDQSLRTALSNFFKPSREKDSFANHFQNMIHDLLFFDEYFQAKLGTDTQHSCGEHKKVFTAAELMIKKLVFLWSDLNLAFIDFFDCKDEIHTATVREMSNLINIAPSASDTDPYEKLKEIKKEAFDQTRNISVSDLDDFDWRLNDESIEYLLSRAN